MNKKDPYVHLPDFISKMEAEGLPQMVIDTFAGYYREVAGGERGFICDAELTPVSADEVHMAGEPGEYVAAGKDALQETVMIVLNGGLGTSMGLREPKSLLEVKPGISFLQVIVEQAAAKGAELALMNSFSTHEATCRALEKIRPPQDPVLFLQHKFPKILREDLSPAVWPPNPTLEWNPPGHGDIYTALVTSGTLQRLLDEGKRTAFICNSDNLGAVLDPVLLGYFTQRRLPFMMEVAERTPVDLKGGHLARRRDGRLVLREAAQCPIEELDAFRDIGRYRYFNTNSLWIDLPFLQELVAHERTVRLPIIVNPKTLDPRDESSPPVYQIETAMGAAVSLFDGAAGVLVDRRRFLPVKKCNQLLALRSDCYVYDRENGFRINPSRSLDSLHIDLDPRYFEKIDEFDARFPEGAPSLVACESLRVRGDVRFEADVVIRGRVTIVNKGNCQAVVRRGSVVTGDLVL